MLLASGLYMARVEWSFTTPWVAVAEVGVVMLALVGAMVGRSLARMGMAVSKSRKGRTSSWEPIPSLRGRHAS